MAAMDTLRRRVVEEAVGELEILEAWALGQLVAGHSFEQIGVKLGMTADESRELAMGGLIKVKEQVFSDPAEQEALEPTNEKLPSY